MRALMLGAVVVVLAACASTGVRVTEEQLQVFKPGETTVDQVVAQLGPPTNRMRMGDGTLMLMYVFAESRIRPATFVPIVGAFAGGADRRSSSAMLRFRPDGKLDSVTSSSSEMGTATGVGAGNPAPVQQPRN